MSPSGDAVFLDAGVLIGALLQDDPRHAEAMPLVESARKGELAACTSTGVLSEVYAALTWRGGPWPQPPADAARVISNLIAPPSAISVLADGLEVAQLHQVGRRARLNGTQDTRCSARGNGPARWRIPRLDV